jgi:hypothetical protein
MESKSSEENFSLAKTPAFLPSTQSILKFQILPPPPPPSSSSSSAIIDQLSAISDHRSAIGDQQSSISDRQTSSLGDQQSAINTAPLPNSLGKQLTN